VSERARADIHTHTHTHTQRLFNFPASLFRFGTKDHSFAGFIVDLLTYSPEDRITPAEALRHPFMAKLFPFFLAQDGTEVTVPLPTSPLTPATAAAHVGVSTCLYALPPHMPFSHCVCCRRLARFWQLIASTCVAHTAKLNRWHPGTFFERRSVPPR
jgi:serine/threonine protein kinase